MLSLRHSIGNVSPLESLARNSQSVPHFRCYASPPRTETYARPCIGSELLQHLLNIHRLSLLPTGLTSYDHTAHAPENHPCSQTKPVVWCIMLQQSERASHSKGLNRMQPLFTPAAQILRSCGLRKSSYKPPAGRK